MLKRLQNAMMGRLTIVPAKLSVYSVAALSKPVARCVTWPFKQVWPSSQGYF